MTDHTQLSRGRSGAWRPGIVAMVAALVLSILVGGRFQLSVAATGAPSVQTTSTQTQAVPSWLSVETAARLDLGFPVLVPGAVPSPFAGEPGVYAASGYYSLYWVNYGGPPTFLEVTGEVGGDIPDGSAYDLNVPLVVNANVQGAEAYRDTTPIYNTVWWQSGGVVYKVSSQGMSGTDSLSLANALTTLVPPAAGGGDPGGGDTGTGDPRSGDPGTLPDDGDGNTPAPEPVIVVPEVVVSGETTTIAVEGISGATLQADAGTFSDTGTRTYDGVGGFSFTWEAPDVDTDQTLGFVLVDPADGQWLATASTQVLAAGAAGIAPDPDGVGSGGEPQDDDDGTGSPAPGPIRPGTTTSNLTGTIAMTCPTVAYSGRLMPIKLQGESPAIVNSTLGGWPVEPTNKRFDPNVDGGPALVGGVADAVSLFIHWRAPTVSDATEVRFFLTHPDGTALAECSVAIQPGEPPARRPIPQLRAPLDHDGTGGPFPFVAPGSSGGTGIPAQPHDPGGDGTGGP